MTNLEKLSDRVEGIENRLKALERPAKFSPGDQVYYLYGGKLKKYTVGHPTFWGYHWDYYLYDGEVPIHKEVDEKDLIPIEAVTEVCREEQ